MSQQLDYYFLEYVYMLYCQIAVLTNLTRKNLLNNVGSLTWYKPLSCDTTNSESTHTSRERTPCEMASHRSSLTALYLATLFEDGHRHTPPEDNT